MKKNNKGFFLAETIVIVALVTTVMAFVYPNVSKLYTTYKNRTNYYDQPEDLYAMKALADFIENVSSLSQQPNVQFNIYNYLTAGKCGNNGATYEAGVYDFSDLDSKMQLIYSKEGIGNDTINNICQDKGEIGTELSCTLALAALNTNANSIISLEKLYIAGYMNVPSDSNYNFNRYLKMMKKTSYDPGSYRLIGVFKDGGETRYASIKIDNPNPIRSCNLGGSEG